MFNTMKIPKKGQRHMFTRKTLYILLLIILLISSGCSARQPQPPTVSDISASPKTNIETGTKIALFVTAVGKNPTYKWSVTDGNIVGPDTNPSIVYTAPDTSGVVTITVDVKDETGLHVTKSIALTIQAPPTPTATATFTPEPTNTPAPTSVPPYLVFSDGKLSKGLDMGVNTSGGLTNWVDVNRGEMCMAYPGGQWGAVFITVGKPVPPGNRPGKDFTAYKTLSIDIKGAQGNEYVLIGLKDKDMPDDGSENKVGINLGNEYQTSSIPLTKFDADLNKLYVVVEFVFENTPEKICVNNIQFLP